jgi:hypothetical protein
MRNNKVDLLETVELPKYIPKINNMDLLAILKSGINVINDDNIQKYKSNILFTLATCSKFKNILNHLIMMDMYDVIRYMAINFPELFWKQFYGINNIIEKLVVIGDPKLLKLFLPFIKKELVDEYNKDYKGLMVESNKDDSLITTYGKEPNNRYSNIFYIVATTCIKPIMIDYVFTEIINDWNTMCNSDKKYKIPEILLPEENFLELYIKTNEDNELTATCLKNILKYTKNELVKNPQLIHYAVSSAKPIFVKLLLNTLHNYQLENKEENGDKYNEQLRNYGGDFLEIPLYNSDDKSNKAEIRTQGVPIRADRAEIRTQGVPIRADRTEMLKGVQDDDIIMPCVLKSDSSVQTSLKYNGFTPEMIAFDMNIEELDKLFKKYDLRQRIDFGAEMSLFHISAYHGNEYLLNVDAPYIELDKYGYNVLHYMCMSGQYELLEKFIKKFKSKVLPLLFQENIFGQTPIDIAYNYLISGLYELRQYNYPKPCSDDAIELFRIVATYYDQNSNIYARIKLPNQYINKGIDRIINTIKNKNQRDLIPRYIYKNVFSQVVRATNNEDYDLED